MRSVILVMAVALVAAHPLLAQERLILKERSPGSALAMCYSPDGSRLAVSFSNDLTVRVYPVAGGAPTVIPQGHDNVVFPRFSPDGRTLVCRTPRGTAVFDATTGRERPALTEPGEYGTFAVSSDGRTLALGTSRGTLRLFDFATLQERLTLQRGAAGVIALALSGDSHTLATVESPGIVRIRKDGKEWDRFDLGDEARNQLWRLTFSPDGAVLAVSNGGRTFLRDLAGRKSMGEIPADVFAFMPYGSAIAALEGRSARFRDLTGRSLRSLPLGVGGKQVLALHLGTGGRSCVVHLSDGEVVLREVPADPAGQEGRSLVLRKAGSPGPLVVTPDGRTALSTDLEGRLQFHDIDARSESFGKKLAAEAPRAPAGRVIALAVSPDGRRAAARLDGGIVRLWDVSGRREFGGDLSLPTLATTLHFNADGSIFTAAGPGGIRRWQVATGKAISLAPAPAEPTLAASMFAWPVAPGGSPAGLGAAVGIGEVLRRLEAGHEGPESLTSIPAVAGKTLATVGRSGSLRLIDLATGKETELQRPVSAILAVTFSHDGRLLATLRIDGSLEIWDAITGKPSGEQTLNSAITSSHTILFAPDGRRLLVYGWGPAGIIDRTARTSLVLDVRAGFTRPQFSADGAILSADDNSLSRRSWEAATGQLLPAPPPQGDNRAPATVLSAAPDGKHVAVSLSDGGVLIWDVARPGEPRAAAGGSPGGVRELRFSPNGRLLASAGSDGSIRLWDSTTGKLLKAMRQHTQRVADIVFSPDGKLLVAEAGDESGSLWDVDSSSDSFGKLRAVLKDLKALSDPGLRVWSPDSKLLAVLIADRKPRTIDAATGAVRHTLPELEANVLQMAFAADGRTLLARTMGGRLYAFDGMTGKEVALPAALPGTIATLVGSPSGWLALGTINRVFLWQGPSGKPPVELAVPSRSGALAFSADDRTLAASGASLRLWRSAKETWEPVVLSRQPDGGPFDLLDISVDGRKVLVKTSQQAGVLMWDIDAGKGASVGPAGALVPSVARLVSAKPLVLVRSPGGSVSLGNPLDGEMVRLHSPGVPVTVSLTSVDGRTTVTGSSDGSLRWYAAGDRTRPRYTLDAHAGPIMRLFLSADGKRLLTTAGPDQVSAWDFTREPKLLRSGTLRNPMAAEWSPDGSRVAVGTDRGEVELWDDAGATRRSLEPGTWDVVFLSLSHDGHTLAALDASATVRVHDTTGKGVLATIPAVSIMALSPDGNWLATTDATGTVRLHEARTGKERGALTSLPPTDVSPGALLFSPNSRTLSITCRDRTVRHWDPAAGRETAKFPWCSPMIFSGDSRWRVGITTAGNVTVWDAATGQEKAHWPGNGQLSVSTDGQTVLLQEAGSGLKLFDVAGGGEPIVVRKQFAEPLSGAVLTQDGRTVIVATFNNQLQFWDRSRGADRAVVRLRDSMPGRSTLTVSEDGRWLVLAGNGGWLHFWDVATARERAVLNAPGNSSLVSQLQMSGDGSTLVASYQDRSVRVFDVKLAAELPQLSGHNGPVAAVALSADGKLVASAGEDRTVRLFAPAAPARAAAVLRGARSSLLEVAISPDGHTIAGAAADGTVCLWPAEVKDELLTLRGHTGWAVRLRYLPDGKRALSTGGDGLRLWDLEKGNLIRAFAQNRKDAQLDLSADGKRCLLPSGLSVWEYDVNTGKELREFKGLTNSTIWVVIYLPGDKEVLAASADGRTLIWDRTTGEQKREFVRPGGFPRCGTVSPDGKWLATGDGQTGPRRDAVRIWDLATGKVVRSFGEYPSEVCCVAWSPDSKRLLAAGADATLRMWDPKTGKELRRMTQPTWVDSVAWLPDGKRALSTGNIGDNDVHLWDVESGKELHRFTGHKQPAISVVVAPNGRTALTAGKDGIVQQWSLGPADPVVLSGHEGEVWSVAFSPDGKLLATGGADRTVRLWDVSGDRERKGYGRLVRTLEGSVQGLLAVAFSPDGKRLAAGEGDPFFSQAGAVRLWDVAGGDLMMTLRGHTGAVRAVGFSSDGKRLATGGTDNTVRLWDPRDGTSQGVLRGHRMAVTGLAFDRDGGLLASAGAQVMTPAESGEVLLWDVAAGRQRGPLVGNPMGLTAVALSPDGTILYASGYDETVRVWSLPRPTP
jgi:WD40 repeat protein